MVDKIRDALIQEAETLACRHPSKDCRGFAQDVFDYLTQQPESEPDDSKILEAIEEAAYFIEALDHSAENDAMVSKLRSALSQQPESEPAVSCSYGQNCEHCEPGHGCRPDRPESEPAACFIMSDSGWPMAVCYDRDMMARLQKDSGGLTIKWLHEHSRPSAQVPEGWRLMPIDPDLKQLEAGRLAAKFVEVDISLNALAVIYAEMRAAAPPIPEPQP